MARMKRTQAGGTWHHVMNRGARQLPIFGDDRDRHAFLRAIGDSTQGPQARVHAYALMANHYHLLVQADVGALAASMKTLGETHTRSFNRRYGYDGPLFRGRYRSKPVLDVRQLRQLVSYIHRNPIDGRASVDEQALRWTSHLAYVGITDGPAWLVTETVLGYFDGDRKAFDTFVLGSAALSDPIEIVGRGVRAATFADIECALGIESEQERAVLRRGGRGVRNDARLAALLLGYRLVEADTGALASRYGYRDGAAARSAVAKAEARLERDARFRDLVRWAESRLAIWNREGMGV